ncbi:Lrp/AsnC family transcriptional regulator [Nocardia pseudobrasiliensis]|uniref:AsnC family transcriptional regulator n=1 Tax=Nocardia pseudobrasiliensis TaxID=45979 RepID=A0A370IHB9_9NOCA|nr:Lrp/AsnC family transcriptional regulator [Nocardia pseudobrasiliensis]RDI68854.1 AsnC family transcriptional regulator [Nocardia pseudobrasiliensis]
MRQSLDATERRIAAALLEAPRASWRTIGRCLNMSERTVLRRAAPLYGDGTLRATIVRNPMCFPTLTPVALRIRCRPTKIGAVARALARRPDTVWVEILGGGDEISIVAFLDGPDARNGLLLRDLPATSAIESWTAQHLIRVFTTTLDGARGLLSAAETASLNPPRPQAHPPVLHESDRRLLDALTADGRASYGELAEYAGLTAVTARRRLEQIVDARMIRLATEVDLALLGIGSEALLWLTVHPSDLEHTGRTLGAHPDVRFAAGTTGATNLLVAVAATDPSDLYVFLTDTLGPLSGIASVETVPILSTVKRTGITR